MHRIELVGVRRSHACTVMVHASRVVFGPFVSIIVQQFFMIRNSRNQIDQIRLSNEGKCGLVVLVQLCRVGTALSWFWPVVNGRGVVGQAHRRVITPFVDNGNVDQHYRRQPRRLCGAALSKAVRSREESILAFLGLHHSRLH